MKFTHDGLVAGVQYLQEHCDGFDDGTGDHYHTPFIRDLLLKVCRASNITPEMPAERRYARETNVAVNHQETGLLLVFQPGPDGAGSPAALFLR